MSATARASQPPQPPISAAARTFAQDRRTLTVTDDDGASATATHAIALIDLTARAYRLKGTQTVDLTWNGSGATSYHVYRDGQRIATATGGSYTDNLNRKGAGSYGYRVCETGGSICSDQEAVSF